MSLQAIPIDQDVSHTITQNICGISDDLSPRLNPLGCFRGIVEDVFRNPVYIVFYGEQNYTFHDFSSFLDSIMRKPHFTQVIACKTTTPPQPGEDNVTLTANY